MRSRAEANLLKMLEFLSKQPLFAGMDGAALSALASEMEWFALAGGSKLFDQDEVSDGLFVLVYGRLTVTRKEPDGRIRELGTIPPGECVGETGLLADEPRYATVIAVRDSELLFLPRTSFERLVSSHPETMLRVVRLVLRRFYSTRSQPARANCFAILPAARGVDADGFAFKLAMALGTYHDVAQIDAATAADKPTAWFSEKEAELRHIVYVGSDDTEWRERCVRQADFVLLLADGSRLPELEEILTIPRRHANLPMHLVLLHEGTPRPGSTRPWLERLPKLQAHHHVRSDYDLERLTRRLTGRATGLVFSGGGARGFAHLGVIRALQEAGYVFDYVGGASIGAIVGAGLAADWSSEQLHEVLRENFVTSNPLSDWTIPLVSLSSGAMVSKRLKAAFGDSDLEDLPTPFFCVSANLTDGVLEVHEEGRVWSALRASCAIPGVLPPVFSAGRVLVDGGVIDNLPVAEMRKRIAGEIYAVDVGGNYRMQAGTEETELPPWWRLLPELFDKKKRKRPSIGQILLRSGMVNSLATAQKRRRQSKLLLSPPLEGIDLLDWQAFERAVEAGYQYARKRLETA